MIGKQIRKEFIEFFLEKGHKEIKSSPVIPIDDPTLLFINAGMNQFKDIFLGRRERTELRAVNSQKCIRAGGKHNDLDEVGKDSYHHTFFEMLGNWSFGDYYKKEAITWAWELLTDKWGLPKDKLFATVHTSDEESFTLWSSETDIKKEHIEYHGDEDNFWEMGETGPCGPCTEIHIDRGEPFCEMKGVEGHVCRVNGDCSRYIELWNLVFIQFNRDQSGELTPLEMQFVDTGAGFERLCQVLQNKKSNYDTDVFEPILKRIEEVSGVPYQSRDRSTYDPEDKGMSHRVIADHIRALSIALADGGYPSNEGRGYVLRRILRRAARYGRLIGLEKPFLHLLVSAVVETLGDYYPELVEKEAFIKTVIKGEEERFNLTLDKGLQKFNEIRNLTKGDTISGKDVFLLYDTYGFPPDLTAILAEESSLKIDEEGFEVEMEKQRSLAREHSNFKMDEVDEDWVYLAELKETQFVGYEADRAEVKILAYTHSDEGKIKLILDKTPFYAESGGQVADKGKLFNKESEIKVTDVKKENDRTVHYVEIQKGELNQDSYTAIIESEYRKDLERNHTATHLLHSVLRELLGEHVQQKGSLVAAGYLRFDFTHFQALTEREKDILETLINKKIRGCSSVEVGLSTIEEAKKDGAIALFGEKYDDTVRTIKIGGYSYELCGGTHLSNTGEIGSFKIISESAIASGVRRIEAITGPYVEEFNKKNEKELSFIAKQLGVPENQITDKIARMIEENRMLNKQIEGYEQQSANKELDDILGRIIDINGVQLAIGKINAKDNNALRAYGDNLRDRLQNGIGVLGSVIDGKASLLVVVSKNLTKHIKAGELISKLAVIVNGRGGGRPDMAMAGGKDYSKIKDAFEEAKVLVQQSLANYKVE